MIFHEKFEFTIDISLYIPCTLIALLCMFPVIYILVSCPLSVLDSPAARTDHLYSADIVVNECVTLISPILCTLDTVSYNRELCRNERFHVDEKLSRRDSSVSGIHLRNDSFYRDKVETGLQNVKTLARRSHLMRSTLYTVD